MATKKKVMNVKDYIDQFYVIGKKNDLNCEYMGQLLYQTILNKFHVEFDQVEYSYFREYQERVYNLIENLRELKVATIKLIFDYVLKLNIHLVDIIIMLWAMPRTDSFLSARMYDIAYKENIEKYNKKMIKLIEYDAMKNFCIETLSKTNYVPIHCIDYLWYYMNGLSFDFVFTNQKSSSFIGIGIYDDDAKSDFKELSFNMEYLLKLGLGKVVYPNDPMNKGIFCSHLKKIVTDIEVIKVLMAGHSNKNYFVQLKNINKNLEKYFGEKIEPLSEKIILELEQML